MKKIVPVITLLMLFESLPHSLAGQDVEKRMTGRFQPMCIRMMQHFDIPGLTIAVVKDGKIAYSHAYGVKNIENSEKMTTPCLFHMASVTKPFVATAVMQLVEKGKVNLDEKVVKYVPYFKLADDRYKIITVRQMLTHTSGMPDVEDYEWDKPVYDDGALERFVRSLTDKKLIAAPGERYRYSNMAYEVLGDLIAKVSGMSFEDYVQKNILTPLKMKGSTLLKKKAEPELLTTPHVKEEGKVVVSKVYPYNRMHAPSSTLISSVLDMSRWAMANLNRGELEGKRILKESTYDIMWTKGKNGTLPVGISWFIGKHGDMKTVSHSGGDTGYRSFVMLLPEKSLGIVLAINYDGTPVITQLMQAALHCALGEDYTLRFERKAISLDIKTMQKYVGKYRLSPDLVLTISLEGKKMFAQAAGPAKLEIFPETETKFFLRDREVDITFVKNEKGEVIQAVLNQGGREVPAKKIE